MPKISELNAITSVSNNDLMMVVHDPNGLPSTNKITVNNFISSVSSLTGQLRGYTGSTGAAGSLSASGDSGFLAVSDGSGVVEWKANPDVRAVKFVYNLAYTANANDSIILVNPSMAGGDVTITLPGTPVEGKVYTVVNTLNNEGQYKVRVTTTRPSDNAIENPITRVAHPYYDLTLTEEGYSWIFATNLYTTLSIQHNSPIFYGSGNTYQQVALQNISAGSEASGDFIVYNDAGNYLTGDGPFIDMGVDSSNYNSTLFGNIWGPNDAYVYNGHGNLLIGTQEDQTIKIFAGNTNVDNIKLLVNSVAIFANTSLLPEANVTYSLGSPELQWKDLYVSNNTIYINNIPLTVDNGGNLSVNGNPVGGGNGTQLVNGVSTVLLNDTLPDLTFINNNVPVGALGQSPNAPYDMILASVANTVIAANSIYSQWIFGTDGNLSTPLGGTVTLSALGKIQPVGMGWLGITNDTTGNPITIVGRNTNGVDCAGMTVWSGAVDGNTGYLTINTYDNTNEIASEWRFQANGELTVPRGFGGASQTIKYGLGDFIAYLDDGWVLGTSNGTAFGAEGIRISPGIEGSTNIVLPKDAEAATRPLQVANYNGNVQIQSTGSYWTFSGNDSTLYTPGGINFGVGDYGFPSKEARLGERLILWNQFASNNFSYSIGIEQDAMWFGVDEGLSSKGFKWYTGNTQVMDLTRAGHLTVNGDINVVGTILQNGGPITASSTDKVWTNPNNGQWVIREYNGGFSGAYDGSNPLVWFNSGDAPYPDGFSEGWQIRGGIVEYHAYDGQTTVVGSITFSGDGMNLNKPATHSEHASGAQMGNKSFWNITANFPIQLAFEDPGNPRNLMIQWTSKIFYGNEYWC